MSEARVYTKPFVLTTLAFFCFFTNVNAFNLLPLYLQALGAQTGEIGTIMAMFSVAAILAQAITGRLLDRGWRKLCLLAALLTTVSVAFGVTGRLGWPLCGLRFRRGGLADRIGRQRVIVPAPGAMTVGVLLCSGLHATWLLLLIGVLNGTAQGFVMPAANALAVERAPSGRRGKHWPSPMARTSWGPCWGRAALAGWSRPSGTVRPSWCRAACSRWAAGRSGGNARPKAKRAAYEDRRVNAELSEFRGHHTQF